MRKNYSYKRDCNIINCKRSYNIKSNNKAWYIYELINADAKSYILALIVAMNIYYPYYILNLLLKSFMQESILNYLILTSNKINVIRI